MKSSSYDPLTKLRPPPMPLCRCCCSGDGPPNDNEDGMIPCWTYPCVEIDARCAASDARHTVATPAIVGTGNGDISVGTAPVCIPSNRCCVSVDAANVDQKAAVPPRTDQSSADCSCFVVAMIGRRKRPDDTSANAFRTAALMSSIAATAAGGCSQAAKGGAARLVSKVQ